MSYGQELMKKYIDLMSPCKYVENYRPEWLYGMELDFYFPKQKIAIEFNGDQHYVHTEFGEHDAQTKRDYLKKQICKERGIWLRVFDASDLEYTRLRGRCGAIFKKASVKNPLIVSKLRKLNKECVSYRKLLIEKWDSPTAHRHKSKIRKQIIDKKS